MQHITNASIQLIPIGLDRHPYAWVDEAIEVIEQSGLSYTVGPFGTVVEGSYQQVSGLIEDINLYLFGKQCPEWVLQVQWHIRSRNDVTVEEKTKGRRSGNSK